MRRCVLSAPRRAVVGPAQSLRRNVTSITGRLLGLRAAQPRLHASKAFRRWQGSAPIRPNNPLLVAVVRGVLYVTYGALAIVVAPGVVAYFLFREPVVVTHRNRAMLLTREQEQELGQQMVKQLDMSHALPADDPRYRAVAAVARRIVTAIPALLASDDAATAPVPIDTKTWTVSWCV